jgi:hypothetical protein
MPAVRIGIAPSVMPCRATIALIDASVALVRFVKSVKLKLTSSKSEVFFLLSTSLIYLTMDDLPNLWPFEELYNLAEDINEGLPAALQCWRNAPF